MLHGHGLRKSIRVSKPENTGNESSKPGFKGLGFAGFRVECSRRNARQLRFSLHRITLRYQPNFQGPPPPQLLRAGVSDSSDSSGLVRKP